MEETAPDVKPFNLNESNSSHAEVIKTSFDPRSLYYDMRGNKYLFIFNHYSYEKTKYFDHKPRSRRGTFADVTSLSKVFKDLNFHVQIYNDLRYEELFETVKTDVIDIDHTNTSCVCIAILTHGEDGGELFAKDRPYELKDLISTMQNPRLVTIPKLFFVQACRGGLADDGQRIEYDGTPPKVILLPTHIDFLIMQSSFDGHASYRAENGSWMIQTLCEVISKYHEEYDILQLITMVNNTIALLYVSNSPSLPSYHNKKQTVETRFTLIKFLKF